MSYKQSTSIEFLVYVGLLYCELCKRDISFHLLCFYSRPNLGPPRVHIVIIGTSPFPHAHSTCKSRTACTRSKPLSSFHDMHDPYGWKVAPVYPSGHTTFLFPCPCNSVIICDSPWWDVHKCMMPRTTTNTNWINNCCNFITINCNTCWLIVAHIGGFMYIGFRSLHNVGGAPLPKRNALPMSLHSDEATQLYLSDSPDPHMLALLSSFDPPKSQHSPPQHNLLSNEALYSRWEDRGHVKEYQNLPPTWHM